MRVRGGLNNEGGSVSACAWDDLTCAQLKKDGLMK